MTGRHFRSILPAGGATVELTLDGTRVAAPAGRNLLATLLLAGAPGAAAEFHCAIGQCQRCAVTVDGAPRLACMTYPRGGETVLTHRPGTAPPPLTGT